MHSPRLSEECFHGRQIKWVEGPSGFLEDGENQSKAGEEEKNSHSSRGGAGFHSFPPHTPFLTWSLELPEPLPACSRCGEGSYVHLDRTLRLEFVRSCKETGALGKARLLSECHLLI